MVEKKKPSKTRRFASYFFRGMLLILGLLLLAIVFFDLTEKGPGAEPVPAGYARNESQYISMDDGAQIAVDICYPADLVPGEQVPAIMLSTRYWRVQQPGFLSRLLPSDVEITGNPIVTLFVCSTVDDGAFHVYLEDVAPGGKVTYLIEGIMRALHRQISDQEPPYYVFGPYHTFERADSASLTPGEVTEITFDLIATSALIETGHQIRVAIAGHDAGAFERIPAGGEPVITLQRNPDFASHIDLPLMGKGG